MVSEWLDLSAEPSPRGDARSDRGLAPRADAEQRIADRFARLHLATAALSAAVTPADVAAVVAARGHALPGAVACWVGLLGEGGRDLQPAASRGVLERGLGAGAVEVTSALPVAVAVREGRAVFEPAPGPAVAAQARASGFPADAVRAIAALPLVARERILGGIAVAFGAAQPFDEEERAFFEAFAFQCAQALDRAYLYEAEREARLEAQRAEEAARRAVEVQQRLVAVVGHDLRTPLAAIRLAAGLLARRGDLSPDQSRTVGRLGASAARMTAIIRDLLDFTRIRNEGALPVERRDVDLSDVARAVVAELHEVHPGREIALDAPAPARGSGDPERLAQVISNLVGNAIQHSPAGGPVRVAVRAEADALVLTVHNDGPAIPATLLPSLFEPFRQGPGAPRDASGSMGLGLFIVRELVAAHAGGVEVDSSDDLGTTFTVRLPSTSPVPTGPAAPER